MPGTDDVLDAAMISQLQDLGGEIFREVVAIFLRDAPQRVNQMRQALADRDAVLMHQAAHTLKGSSANVGLQRVVRACTSLDHAARVGDLGQAQTLIDQIVTALTEDGPPLQAMAQKTP